ncbi:MAG: N-acetylmuramoyl-L-alanine amidase [Hyphomicrobium sp.]|nr:N-acetylmuramoyl-L-alanine amidase [Hyphomicrobium sp.]
MGFSASRAALRVCCIAITLGLTAPLRAEDTIATVVAPKGDLLAITVAARTDLPATPHTRFVVGLDRKVDYQVFSLSNPNRVVVELPDVRLRLPDPVVAASKGLVTAFRGGLAAPGKSRVVIDVAQPVIVESSKLSKDAAGQYRLAIDIMPAEATPKSSQKKSLSSQPSGLGAAGIQPPLPKRAENPKSRAAKAFKPIIVLDPGHGGMDTGATKFGTVEKQVVLAFGHVLRELLEKTGRYKVMMTRDKDFFVELDERLAYGERNNANLFIAIHADYANSSARGATIFTLRDSVAKDLERSTKSHIGSKLMTDREISTVKATNGDVDAVRDILSDLAELDVQRTKDRTSVFAKSVVETMGESTPMRHDPEQQAAFRVLKTAQFPSVLIELAYVTNKQDANNLNSDAWRSKVADSIVTAIDNYFNNQVARLPM